MMATKRSTRVDSYLQQLDLLMARIAANNKQTSTKVAAILERKVEHDKKVRNFDGVGKKDDSGEADSGSGSGSDSDPDPS